MTEEGNVATHLAEEFGRPLSSDANLRAQNALRLVLLLLALWTLLSGLALTLFQGASGATIGGGLEGGEGDAAQRLLGVHLLVLAPVYGLIAWQPERYRLIAWIPYVTQAGIVLVTLFDVVTGRRDIQDAVLPLFVSLIFLVLLVYFWRAARLSEDEAGIGGTAPATLPAASAPVAQAPPAAPFAAEDVSD